MKPNEGRSDEVSDCTPPPFHAVPVTFAARPGLTEPVTVVFVVGPDSSNPTEPDRVEVGERIREWVKELEKGKGEGKAA